jgi:hypothetical protein
MKKRLADIIRDGDYFAFDVGSKWRKYDGKTDSWVFSDGDRRAVCAGDIYPSQINYEFTVRREPVRKTFYRAWYVHANNLWATGWGDTEADARRRVADCNIVEIETKTVTMPDTHEL